MRGAFDSFFRFTLGFMFFISLSLGITYGVTAVSAQQTAAVEQASALQALLHSSK